jgi:hypothetical protein
MNKRLATVTIIVLILVFVGYIVVDVALKKELPKGSSATTDASVVSDKWAVIKVFEPG